MVYGRILVVLSREGLRRGRWRKEEGRGVWRIFISVFEQAQTKVYVLRLVLVVSFFFFVFCLSEFAAGVAYGA